jgi:N-acetylglucosamine kinase-like BadF-type ATPase
MCIIEFYFSLQQTQTKTVIRTIPSSMISQVKAGQAGVQTGPGGAKTIVIAAPKGSGTAGQTPTKILSTMPKLAGQGNTQFIVVSPQGSNVVGQGGLLHYIRY